MKFAFFFFGDNGFPNSFYLFFFIFTNFLYSIDVVLNYMVVWLNYKIRADTVEENLWLFTY